MNTVYLIVLVFITDILQVDRGWNNDLERVELHWKIWCQNSEATSQGCLGDDIYYQACIMYGIIAVLFLCTLSFFGSDMKDQYHGVKLLYVTYSTKLLYKTHH